MSDYTSKYNGYLTVADSKGEEYRVYLETDSDAIIYSSTEESLTDVIDDLLFKLQSMTNPIGAHTGNTNNPHKVTADQVGAVSLYSDQVVEGSKTFVGDVTINNLIAENISGNGSGITNIQASNIVGWTDMENNINILLSAVSDAEDSAAGDATEYMDNKISELYNDVDDKIRTANDELVEQITSTIKDRVMAALESYFKQDYEGDNNMIFRENQTENT
jgi:hypothetical protein